MATRILAGALLVLAIALGGCTTYGTSTFASTNPFLTNPDAGGIDASGNNYRVFPGDEIIPATPVNDDQ